MVKKTFILGIALFLCVPFAVSAGPIVRSGDSIVIDAEQSLKGDFYGLGSDIMVSGTAENDVYVLGGSITLNAPTNQDLTAIGGVVQVHGEVGDDVRIVGGEVTIAKPVKGDVVVLGGELTILSTATIEGDVLFYGETLNIQGTVVGSVHGTARTVRIDTEIGNDLSLTAHEQLILGDSARIQGSITYKSNAELTRAQGAEVSGEIQRIKVVETEEVSFTELFALEIFIFIFAALTLYVTMRPWIVKTLMHRAHSIGMYGLVGLALFLVVPLISLLLFVSVIGFFLSILVFLAYIVTLIALIPLSGMYLGHILMRLFNQEKVTALSVCVGMCALVLFPLIPFFGGFAIFAAMMIVFGKLGFVLYESLHD